MASLAHLSVGLAAGRWRANGWRSAALYAALAMVPDADVVAFWFHIPYANQFGHRGATHSIAFALVVALLAALASRKASVAALVFAVVTSHPVLDMFTTGGLGCALLWPFTDERFFWPVRPIPVAPIGAGMLSARGLWVVVVEFIATLPLLVWAVARKSKPARSG